MTAAPHPGFLVQGHILSTGGDALRHPPCSRSFLPEFSHMSSSSCLFIEHSVFQRLV
jgi:hypothetical protein